MYETGRIDEQRKLEMGIQEDAMIVNLSIGFWHGYRVDQKKSEELTESAGAEADAARVNKHLIPKEALKTLTRSANTLRSHFYDRTLPWRDNGDRLLPRKMYMRFIDEHGDRKHSFVEEVDSFVTQVYPKIRESAAFRMGDMFNVDDYPHPDEVRRRFNVSLSIDAVSSADDFRVALDKAAAAEVRASIEAELTERIARASRAPFERLFATIERFKLALEGERGVRKSTLENLTELADILPQLNFSNDHSIDSLCARVKLMLGNLETTDLKNDPALKLKLSKDAAAIMSKMAGYMSAMA